MELVDFLRARLDEDEEIAKEAGERSMEWRLVTPLDDAELGDAWWLNPPEKYHAERHDPARVLAEVEAKRATIADYEKALRKRDGLEPNTAGYRHWDNRAFGLYLALRHAVAVYADYPGYAEALAAEEAALLADE